MAGASEAYTNPQIVIDKSFEVWNQRNNHNIQKRTQSLEAIIANNKIERASQRALEKTQREWEVKLYDTVGSMPETGYNTFDQNKDVFFNSQIDKYVKIKNGIDNGSIPANEGGRALAKINEQVQAYQQAAPAILAQAKLVQEARGIPAGEPGSMSVRTPTAQQKVLLGLIENENVNIVDKNGELVLYMPPQGKEGDKDYNPGGMVNVNELINYEASGKEYFKTVPDIAPTLSSAATSILGSSKTGGFNDKYVTIKSKRTEDGKNEITTREMTSSQRELAKQDIIKTNLLEPILKDEERMNSVWADMMEKDTDWDPSNKEMVEEAQTFLANKAIDDNSALDGISQIIGTRKYTSPKRTGLSAAQIKAQKKEDEKQKETLENLAYMKGIRDDVKELNTMPKKADYLNKNTKNKTFYAGEEVIEAMQKELDDIPMFDPNKVEIIEEIYEAYGFDDVSEIDKNKIYEEIDGKYLELDDDGDLDGYIIDELYKLKPTAEDIKQDELEEYLVKQEELEKQEKKDIELFDQVLEGKIYDEGSQSYKDLNEIEKKNKKEYQDELEKELTAKNTTEDTTTGKEIVNKLKKKYAKKIGEDKRKDVLHQP